MACCNITWLFTEIGNFILYSRTKLIFATHVVFAIYFLFMCILQQHSFIFIREHCSKLWDPYHMISQQHLAILRDSFSFLNLNTENCSLSFLTDSLTLLTSLLIWYLQPWKIFWRIIIFQEICILLLSIPSIHPGTKFLRVRGGTFPSSNPPPSPASFQLNHDLLWPFSAKPQAPLALKWRWQAKA